MTPSARLSAAIELLDQILAGEPAERALTRWARGSRFAGSKDRAAVRDTVYDCIRQKRSFGHLGGGMTGRAIVIAHQFHAGEPLDQLFTGEGFAPAPITLDEQRCLDNPIDAENAIALDYPDFLDSELRRSLGLDLASIMQAMQSRAPVDLRVNTLKTTVAEAQKYLARDLIFTDVVDGVPNALRITQNPRKLNGSLAYRYGFVELQDVSSQKIARFCGVQPGMRVLDYCAGGGGKTLALAALMNGKGDLMAHDVNPSRMKDLPDRSRRAGADINIIPPARLSRVENCNLVLVDAPCSGSGAWRRNPDSKWRLAQSGLDKLNALQDEILNSAKNFVADNGSLVYATCSLLTCENDDRTANFLAQNPEWSLESDLHLSPQTGGDGFYAAILRKNLKAM
ncbi:MAG: RsmB/NOP family class I SAM-dependent RNA methyltransferase [Rhodobacteraceae bacterium]|nr:RsmB/NOP family class I SAM-dependent RNA methyltransferase [Paracoccaceae bacterium]